MLLLLGWLVAACDFRLRGGGAADGSGKQLFVDYAKIGVINQAMPQAITSSGAAFSKTMVDASAVIHVLQQRDERRITSLNRGGRGNLFNLYTRVVYEIKTPKGELIAPPQEVLVVREYYNDQLSPIGQGEEEAQFRLEMHREVASIIVRQTLFRLNTETLRVQ
jgi:LPS-assembly lipoprotein